MACTDTEALQRRVRGVGARRRDARVVGVAVSVATCSLYSARRPGRSPTWELRSTTTPGAIYCVFLKLGAP